MKNRRTDEIVAINVNGCRKFGKIPEDFSS